MSKLKEDFLVDLAKACIVSTEILAVVKPHLSYTYITGEPYKLIFKYLFDYHSAHAKSPTLGLVSQNVTQRDALPILGKIRDADIFENKEGLLETLEEYIKRAKFLTGMKDMEELFNKQKHDEAYESGRDMFEKLNAFSLKRDKLPRIFRDYPTRQRERKEKEPNRRKIPFGIPQLDCHTRGGQDIGRASLSIARGGGYKSTGLVSRGGAAAFAGFNVVHFVAGDAMKDEVEQLYDAWWTQVDRYDVAEGNIGEKDFKKIERARQAYINECGEIFVKKFEEFHAASIADCRKVLIDIMKEMEIHLAIFDYLELFEPGDGKRYGTNQEGSTAKKKATAESIVRLGSELNIATSTTTQAIDITKDKWNNPNYVITRSELSNSRGAIDPFAYNITYNQTEDERDQQILRIHEDKLRGHMISSFEATYHIAQRLSEARFCDISATNKRFWDEEEKKIIRNIAKKVA